MIASLLDSLKTHNKQHPLTNLSENLHYISSTYANLDLQKLIANCFGNIELIQY